VPVANETMMRGDLPAYKRDPDLLLAARAGASRLADA
jgi:hypothetical protein